MATGVVLPRFYIVFVSNLSSNSLLIPSSYYEHLPRRLPKMAILMGTGGRFWKVAMRSKGEQVYFDQGWEIFVADNELQDGELLTFVFDGHHKYEVSIYGRGGCKETRAAIEVEEIIDDTESDNSDDESCKETRAAIEVEEINDDTESDNSDDESCKETRAAIEVEDINDDTESDNSDDESLVDITPMPVSSGSD